MEQKQWLTVVAAVVILIAIVIGSVVLLITQPPAVQIIVNPPVPTATPLPTATPAPVNIYVTGAVQSPESRVVLPPRSRVEAALQAAGGALPDADLARVNLAAFVRDGDQVHVPRVGEADIALATPSGGVVVAINSANSEALQTLPGIGPALAERIIAYREANGRFASLDELQNVSGIGAVTLDNMRDLIALD